MATLPRKDPREDPAKETRSPSFNSNRELADQKHDKEKFRPRESKLDGNRGFTDFCRATGMVSKAWHYDQKSLWDDRKSCVGNKHHPANEARLNRRALGKRSVSIKQ